VTFDIDDDRVVGGFRRPDCFISLGAGEARISRRFFMN